MDDDRDPLLDGELPVEEEDEVETEDDGSLLLPNEDGELPEDEDEESLNRFGLHDEEEEEAI